MTPAFSGTQSRHSSCGNCKTHFRDSLRLQVCLINYIDCIVNVYEPWPTTLIWESIIGRLPCFYAHARWSWWGWHFVMADMGWPGCATSLKGVILDMCGVLYDSGDGDGVAIPGSIEAVKKLKASDLQLRFCTNETQAAREKFVAKLQRLGFDILVSEVFSPAPAAVAVLKERGLRPHLLVYDGLLPEFDSVDKTNPNCVVIGDAAEKFTYQNLNDAFRVLTDLEKPVLFSLGQGKYYKETDGLKLDVGAYMKALEYACDLKAEVVGKPSPTFFQSVLNDMGLQPHEALMIGDDLVNDVGGAQHCGMKGVQVRTGKYRPSDERHCTVTADGTVDDLAQAVDTILNQRL